MLQVFLIYNCYGIIGHIAISAQVNSNKSNKFHIIQSNTK